MADITRKIADEWVEMIAQLHNNVATDPGDEREAAPEDQRSEKSRQARSAPVT